MRFDGLHVLRGLAALGILLFHVRGYTWIIGGNEQTIFSVFRSLGSTAVFVFFAISGFLMAHLIATGYRWFLVRRLLRIYPSFILATIFMVALKWVALGQPWEPHYWQALTLLPLGLHTTPLNIEWTLIYEVFFYIVCSFFAFDATRRYFVAFLITWAAAIMLANGSAGVQREIMPDLGSIWLQWFNLIFIAGALAYHFGRSWQPDRFTASYVAALAGLVLVTYDFLGLPFQADARATDLVQGAIAALLVMVAAKLDAPHGRVGQIAAKLGDYSYGIYLVHPAVLLVTVTLLLPLGANSWTASASFVLALAAGCLMGDVDARLHRWMAGVFSQRSRAAHHDLPVGPIADEDRPSARSGRENGGARSAAGLGHDVS